MNYRNFFTLLVAMTLSFSLPLMAQEDWSKKVSDFRSKVDAATNKAGSLSSLVENVVGSKTATESDLIGTWCYASPKCSFTSSSLLAQAGGVAAATKIEEKIAPHFKRVGVTKNNTQFTFQKDKTFQAKVNGYAFSGTYVFIPKSGKLELKSTYLSLSGYATKTGKKLDLVFDTTKLLKLFQKVSKAAAAKSSPTLTSLADSYKGSRLGFEMTKK